MGIYQRLVTKLDSTLAFSPEVQASIESERILGNRRRATYGLPVLALIHVATVLAAFSYAPKTAMEATWREGVMMGHGALALFHFIAFTAFMFARNRAGGQWLAGRIAEIAVAYALPLFALVAINGQRAHSSITVFIMAAMASPLWFRVRVSWYVPTLLLSSILLSVGIEWTQVDAASRMGNRMVALGFIGVGTWLAIFARNAQSNEVGNRMLLDSMNDELKRRVDEQVAQIVARASEIERLNRHLNARVRERSRELSKALARLGVEQEGMVKPGSVLGERVVVNGLLGMGGMGAVYRGYDQLLGQDVAVKVVQATSANQLDALARFLSEAETIASVNHPAIIRSFHVDVSKDGRLFQVLELVKGRSLSTVLSLEKQLPASAVATLGATLADALAAAHDAGIVHRDVTPANVMLCEAAPGVKLLDFGLSKFSEYAGDGPSPSDEVLIGTPAFLSPEQVESPLNVSPAGDVYSLGLVLYECIAGVSPYTAKSVPDWLVAHAKQAPVELSHRVPEINEQLATCIMSCLNKNPAQRPTARALAATLSNLQSDSPSVSWASYAAPMQPTEASTQAISV